jgi:hypothetical protein
LNAKQSQEIFLTRNDTLCCIFVDRLKINKVKIGRRCKTVRWKKIQRDDPRQKCLISLFQRLQKARKKQGSGSKRFGDQNE